MDKLTALDRTLGNHKISGCMITAGTKLAPQGNSKGQVNGAWFFFHWQRHPLTVSLLAAAGCSSRIMPKCVPGVLDLSNSLGGA